MREIKFRGKRIDNGEWVYGYYFQGFTGISYILVMHDHILGMTEFYEVDPSTVGQFTGLKDINGKEIYKGDIVSFDDCTSTESGYWEQSCIGVVEWCNETVSFEVTNRLSAESYEVLDECVVIGNIYENPELFGESYEN